MNGFAIYMSAIVWIPIAMISGYFIHQYFFFLIFLVVIQSAIGMIIANDSFQGTRPKNCIGFE